MLIHHLIGEGMKPKILKPLDAEKIMNDVKNQIVRKMKAGGLRIGHVQMWQEDGLCHIDIENNGGDILNVTDNINHKNVEIVSSKHRDGIFDWAADYYIKDSDEVSFKLAI